MDIIQNDNLLLRAPGLVVHNGPKDNTRVGRGDFDGGLHREEGMRGDVLLRGTFDEFQVSEGGEFKREVLQGFGGLVDEEDVENDVEFVDFDECFRVDGVGETGQLDDSAEFRGQVVNLGGTTSNCS